MVLENLEHGGAGEREFEKAAKGIYNKEELSRRRARVYMIKNRFTSVYALVTYSPNTLLAILVGAVLNLTYVLPLFYGAIMPLMWIMYTYMKIIERPWFLEKQK